MVWYGVCVRKGSVEYVYRDVMVFCFKSKAKMVRFYVCRHSTGRHTVHVVGYLFIWPRDYRVP